MFLGVSSCTDVTTSMFSAALDALQRGAQQASNYV
jgi:hypothetical protein